MDTLDQNKFNESTAAEQAVDQTMTDIADNDQIKTIETSNPEQSEAVPTPTNDFSHLNKEELLSRLKELIQSDVERIKDEVDAIKQQFYKKNKIEAEEQKQQFLDNGGEESQFFPSKDELETKFKDALSEYKSKRTTLLAQQEKEREDNLLQKQHILEQMKAFIESNEDVSSYIQEFRALQQKWKQIGPVPATITNELWKKYNLYQESFWDLIKINNEFREYDFRKNLELKTQLCETAEKLASHNDIISAFQQLQKLHEEWHEIGPVAREFREQVWNRFKEASSSINKKHQAYFEDVRKLETENYEAKLVLCEKLETFEVEQLKSFKDWSDATNKILEWQEEWKKIGFAPRKQNQAIYDRYRKACNQFFASKTKFLKETKNLINQNLEKKKELCQQVELLKDSQEWKETSDKLIQLQKEWKTIGTVSKKQSDELWKRFISACDYFFEQKNLHQNSQKTEEQENLIKKKELIDKVLNFERASDNEDSLANLRQLIDEWGTIGHVPFRDKDKIYKQFRTALDKQYEALNVDVKNRKIESFKNNIKETSTRDVSKVYRERDKLLRIYEHLKAEIATYENNIGFLTSNSKKGSGIIKEMEQKIQLLKEECNMLEKKINLIDEVV